MAMMEARDFNAKNEKIITDLQNQVNDLERSREEDITILELFNQGKYKDEVRQVYMDLLSMGVSVNQCQNVIKCHKS
jgi:uncharacterized protein (UPF0335 family)